MCTAVYVHADFGQSIDPPWRAQMQQFAHAASPALACLYAPLYAMYASASARPPGIDLVTVFSVTFTRASA